MFGSNRKRAFSTPHISPAIITSMLNTVNRNNFTAFRTSAMNSSNANLFAAAGQVVHNMTDAWSTQGRSDTNIYTNLALGDDRYKLPVPEAWTRESSVGFATADEDADNDDGDEEDEDEATDQFSPTIYHQLGQQSHSIPIPISAGNSPQHILVGGQRTPKVPSPTHMAYSASPTASGYPYSPFYSSSPDMHTTVGALPTTKISFSYDPAHGINRLAMLPSQLQQRQHQEQPPLDAATTTAAVVFSTSPTSALSNSSSGTSAVAIDNKIEQAMDLVKSHLMIAVREEVEVLKEKISELMDKINQLEVENTLLKANMSQEKLKQLQVQIATAPPEQQQQQTQAHQVAQQPPTQAQTQQQQPTQQQQQQQQQAAQQQQQQQPQAVAQQQQAQNQDVAPVNVGATQDAQLGQNSAN